jgi:hypothetical protein
MKVLREQRSLSRGRAILWGLKSRAAATGWPKSLLQTMGILAVDSFRSLIFSAFRFGLIYPLRWLGALIRVLTGANNRQPKKAE